MRDKRVEKALRCFNCASSQPTELCRGAAAEPAPPTDEPSEATPVDTRPTKSAWFITEHAIERYRQRFLPDGTDREITEIVARASMSAVNMGCAPRRGYFFSSSATPWAQYVVVPRADPTELPTLATVTPAPEVGKRYAANVQSGEAYARRLRRIAARQERSGRE